MKQSSMNKTFYIGTTNPGKMREFAGILKPLGFELEQLDLDVPETGTTFEFNAVEKARAYAGYAQGLTIAEDSGLVIPALDGLPGPWSARFADLNRGTMEVASSGRERDEIDCANNQLVLQMMEGIEEPNRAAKFVVCLVVVDGMTDKVLFKESAYSYGRISTEERGTHGFGYDPIFIGDDTFNKTYAELDSMRKNLRSHRQNVIGEFRNFLFTLTKENSR